MRQIASQSGETRIARIGQHRQSHDDNVDFAQLVRRPGDGTAAAARPGGRRLGTPAASAIDPVGLEVLFNRWKNALYRQSLCRLSRPSPPRSRSRRSSTAISPERAARP